MAALRWRSRRDHASIPRAWPDGNSVAALSSAGVIRVPVFHGRWCVTGPCLMRRKGGEEVHNTGPKVQAQSVPGGPVAKERRYPARQGLRGARPAANHPVDDTRLLRDRGAGGEASSAPRRPMDCATNGDCAWGWRRALRRISWRPARRLGRRRRTAGVCHSLACRGYVLALTLCLIGVIVDCAGEIERCGPSAGSIAIEQGHRRWQGGGGKEVPASRSVRAVGSSSV
jgi:hypothetical protein